VARWEDVAAQPAGGVLEIGDLQVDLSKRDATQDRGSCATLGPVAYEVRSWVTAAVAVIAPLVTAAALIPFRDPVDHTNAALVLVAVVVAVAALAGRRSAGILAPISAFVSFDLFDTRPYGSLAIANRHELVTALVLLVVGLIVGELSTRTRRHRRDADEASLHVARIHAVAELVAAGAAPEDVIVVVRNELQDLLGLQSCRFLTSLPETPRARLERNGEVVLGGLRWGSRMGLPGREIDLYVQGQGRPLGRFVLGPTPGRRVPWDERVAAVALADQVGAALATIA